MRAKHLAAAIGAVLLLLAAGALGQGEPFVIVVNRNNPAVSVSKDDLRKYYLRNTGSWDDGTRVLPVDLPVDSSLRTIFSEQVIGKSVAAVASFWQRQLFSGRRKPPFKAGDSEKAVEFVRGQRGGIAYVSAEVSLDDVKVVPISE